MTNDVSKMKYKFKKKKIWKYGRVKHVKLLYYYWRGQINKNIFKEMNDVMNDNKSYQAYNEVQVDDRNIEAKANRCVINMYEKYRWRIMNDAGESIVIKNQENY